MSLIDNDRTYEARAVSIPNWEGEKYQQHRKLEKRELIEMRDKSSTRCAANTVFSCELLY